MKFGLNVAFVQLLTKKMCICTISCDHIRFKPDKEDFELLSEAIATKTPIEIFLIYKGDKLIVPPNKKNGNYICKYSGIKWIKTIDSDGSMCYINELEEKHEFQKDATFMKRYSNPKIKMLH
jgi:hypothetical protein